MGYFRAGFDEIVGVDIEPMPHYPFEFKKADALKILKVLLTKGAVRPDSGERCWYTLKDFDAIHASPPCQRYSRMRHLPWLRGKEYPDLLPPTLAALKAQSLPWVVENVEDAPLERASTLFGEHGVLLCGQMFGLPLYRHRAFETSFPIGQPEHPRHRQTILAGRYLNKRYSQSGGVTGVIPVVSVVGHTSGMMKFAPQAMGIDWMNRDELGQAIPPAYTEYIGRALIEQLAPTP